MITEFVTSCKSHSVVSKKLVRQITEMVNESANEYIVYTSPMYTGAMRYMFDCSQFVEFVEMYLTDIMEKSQLIEQYDVICDHRNNCETSLRHGVIHMMIKFRQTHCLNTTSLDYSILARC